MEPADWYTQVLSDDEVRDLYGGAAVVVVPTKDVPQPSGQSVTLQAMACARPVVLSRTRGLWSPESLRDGENVVLASPADPDRLAQSVRLVLDDERRAAGIGSAARETVLKEATVERYAERRLAVCRLVSSLPDARYRCRVPEDAVRSSARCSFETKTSSSSRRSETSLHSATGSTPLITCRTIARR